LIRRCWAESGCVLSVTAGGGDSSSSSSGSSGVSSVVFVDTSATVAIHSYQLGHVWPVVYPGNFFGGGSTNSVEDRERGSGGGSLLVRGSGDSCNLVQEISFHIVNFS
jgi:hypothetical protein